MENMYFLLSWIAFFIAWFLTKLIRKYALKKDFLDVPNERSSHETPTPSGGGLAFAISFYLSLFAAHIIHEIEVNIVISMLMAGLLILVIGLVDDRLNIAARWRIIAHVLAASWISYHFSGLPHLELLSISFGMGWLGHALLILGLVWLINLFNFMDGIDGLAAIEAVTVCLGGAMLYQVYPSDASKTGLLYILSASVLGFLFWNFPKAKIFMGDAGSGFLGLLLGVFIVQAAWVASELFWGWLILLGVFLVDSTFTLVRRILLRENFYKAHRTHAYQYAARKFGSHVPVSLGIAGINLVWLLPLAILVVKGDLKPEIGLFIAYLPLILAAVYFKAGMPEIKIKSE